MDEVSSSTCRCGIRIQDDNLVNRLTVLVMVARRGANSLSRLIVELSGRLGHLEGQENRGSCGWSVIVVIITLSRRLVQELILDGSHRDGHAPMRGRV